MKKRKISSEMDNALAWAAFEGEAAGIRAALDAGADPNTMLEGVQGEEAPRLLPALAAAAMAGCPEGVKALLDAGADPAFDQARGRRPFIWR